MPIISVKDNENNRWNRNANKKQTKTGKIEGGKSYSERVRDKWFCCAFTSGFLEFICKASLIFKVKYRVSFINYQ